VETSPHIDYGKEATIKSSTTFKGRKEGKRVNGNQEGDRLGRGLAPDESW